MVVKSRVVSEDVGDLPDIFEILRKHKLRISRFEKVFRLYGDSQGN